MIISKSFKAAKLLVPAAALVMSACGGDSGTNPKSGLSQAQKTKVSTILTQPSVVQAILGSGDAAMGAAMMPLIAQNLVSLGSINITAPAGNLLPGARYNIVPSRADIAPAVGSYKAFGGQLVFSVKVDDQQEMEMSWTGVIAFNDLDNPTDIITAGVTKLNSSTAPTGFSSLSFGTQSGDVFPYAAYIKIASGGAATGYNATSGSIQIDEVKIGSSKSCTDKNIPMLKACSMSSGNLKGSFGFTGRATTGSATVTIPNIALDVPAVRMIMKLELSTGIK